MATKYRITCTDCPFDRTYSSPAKGGYAFGRHSCERWLRIAELRARGEARKAAIDRTPKPCLHKETDHVHGTYACYVLDFCRCEPCAASNRDYEKDRVRQQAYGRWNGLVDAEPARRHVRELMAQGMGLKRIVAVSELSQGQLWKLLYGKKRPDGTRSASRRITPRVEQRILAVRLDLADGARIDSTGAVRRIRALVALGWSQSKIAARLGIQAGNFTPIAQGRRPEITVAHDKAVRALYAEWSMQLPPQMEWRDKIAANRARNYAKTLGWLPPLAWDDDLIDDPEATALTGADDGPCLDHAAIERRILGDKSVRLTKDEKADLLRRMVAKGVPKNEIERRTGINPHREYTAPEGVSA